MGDQQVRIEFKEIPGMEYYSVSRKGDVKSNRRGRLLTPRVQKDGYVTVHLSFDGEDLTALVHRLVAMAYLPNPENKPTVNHKDGDKQNNCVSNLEWATYPENMRHAFDNGLIVAQRGEDRWSAVLSEEDVHGICRMLESGESVKGVSDKLGLNIKTVSNINTGQKWKYIFKEYDLRPVRQPRISEKDLQRLCEFFSEGGAPDDAIDIVPYVTKTSIESVYKRKTYKGFTSSYVW